MKISQLRKQYKEFERVSFTLELNKKEMKMDGNFEIEELQIECSMSMMTNYCEVTLGKIKSKSNLLTEIATGASFIVKGGYQKDEQVIFQGYVQSLRVSSVEEGYLDKIYIYAQDVKGLMMLNKSAFITSGKKRSTLIQEIFKNSFYKKYIKACSIKSLPAALDGVLYQDGKSDYDLMEQICQDCFYCCYVSGDTLYFNERHTPSSKTLTIDEWNHIDVIEVATSMENQIGKIRVVTCDGFDSKKEVKDTYNLSSMPFTSVMDEVLSATSCVITDNSFVNIDEVKTLATSFIKEAKHSYATLHGEGVFLSEYMVGSRIEITQFPDKKRKVGYLNKVVHTLNQNGAKSRFEAVLTKG